MEDDSDKILGVIGGMGPLATQLFYRMVIERTDACADQEHINMILLSHATMPDRTEAILSGAVAQVEEKLIADGIFLENSGAAAVAIPCNTSHYWIEKLQGVLSIPVINMIEETVLAIGAKPGLKRVGILATDGTVRTGLYQKACERQGLTPITLSEESQKIIMSIIYDGIKDGGPIDTDGFNRVAAELRNKDCDCAIMACTELSCFKEMYGLPDYYLDAMEILAEKSVLVCGKRLKKKPME